MTKLLFLESPGISPGIGFPWQRPAISVSYLPTNCLSAAKILRGPEDGWGCSEMTRAGYYGQPSGNSERTQSGGSHCRSR